MASTPATTDVSIPLPGGAALAAALAQPDGAGPHPGVLVLHESFGLNDDIRRIAGRFAEEGYAALAPDLYSHGSSRLLCLTRVMLDMVRHTPARELAHIEAARAWLAARPDVDADRIGVAGFCQGGGFALLVGTQGKVKAAAVHYGDVPKDQSALDGVCPVVASYGGTDLIFTSHARRLEHQLDALGVAHDVKIYDGAGHSFMSYDNGPAWLFKVPSPLRAGYCEAEAEDAWNRMLGFFAEHVGG